jgi:hypothetical protein
MKTVFCTILCVLLFLFSQALIISKASGNWNNPSTWVGGIIPNASTDDIEIVSGHAITMTADAIVGDITITKGSISIGSNLLTIYGNLSGTQIDNLTSTSSSKLQIKDKGNASAFEFPAGIVDLQKLTINRASGANSSHNLDLSNNVPSDSIVLILTNGIIYMKNNSKFLLNNKGISRDIPSSDSTYIDGIVSRDIPKNKGIYIFPVGNAGHARPMGIGTQSGNGANINEVQFFFTPPILKDNVAFGTLPGGINQNMYWKQTTVSGANPQRRLYYKDSDFPPVSDTAKKNALTLANTDGTQNWNKPTTPLSVDDTQGHKWVEFKGANASNNEYWTFGSTNSDVNIQNFTLPINLLYFRVTDKNNIVEIRWATASEINNNLFSIERSSDGNNFVEILTIKGANNSTRIINYTTYDEDPPKGILYYRLKQTDNNGTYSYSKIESINKQPIAIWFNNILIKNTSKNNWEINFDCNENQNINTSLINLGGKKLFYNSEFILANSEYTNLIELDNYCNNSGLYILSILGSKDTFQTKIFYNK